jgi:hypothetical protein
MIDWVVERLKYHNESDVAREVNFNKNVLDCIDYFNEGGKVIGVSTKSFHYDCRSIEMYLKLMETFPR